MSEWGDKKIKGKGESIMDDAMPSHPGFPQFLLKITPPLSF